MAQTGQRRWPRTIGAVLVVVLAALAGVYAVAGLAPERLRQEVEALLSDATGGPVVLQSLRLVIGFPMYLEAFGLDVWEGALVVDHATARLSPLSLLVGKPRLSALEADGVALTLTRTAQGHWEPALDPGAPPPPPVTDEPLLGALEVLERGTRGLLERPTLADTFVFRRSTIRYVDGPTGRETLRFASLGGELVHRALRGDAELQLHTDMSIGGGEPAAAEAHAIRSRENALTLSIAVTALDLRSVEGRGIRALRGSLSGILDYQAEKPGAGDVSLDFRIDKLALPKAAGEQRRRLKTPRFGARIRASVSPLQLDIADASLSAGTLGAKLAATLERPIDSDSHMGLTLVVDDVDLARAHTLVGWLPEESRETAEEALARVVAGSLTRIEARGGAGLDEWSRLTDGHTQAMPWGMRLVADAEGLSLDLGEGDRLEGISGQLSWSGDQVAVNLSAGQFNGSPLPKLDAEVHGVSHLFAADPARRELVSGAPPLPGLEPLWEALWGKGEGDGEPATALTLELDYIHHPTLLWPLEGVRARIEPNMEHTRVEIERAEWAGIPLEGSVVAHTQEDRIEIRVVADGRVGSVGSRRPLQTPTEAGPIWAAGRFEMGSIAGPRWRQKSARGAFQASGDEMDITGVTIALEPRGELQGAGWLELGDPDRALFRVEASLQEGDAESVMSMLASGDGVTGGTMTLDASLSGALAPELPLLARLSGNVKVAARGGAIRASVPAIVALALATDTLNAFGGHDKVRYDAIETRLQFHEGRMSTEAFDIDGPDLRMFVSGELDLLRKPHPVNAELALFLFRQIDRALVNIPIVNALLLGGNDNMVAAYFSLEGPWEKPVATPLPLRTLTESPAGSVLTGIPKVMTRGLRALGGILRAGAAKPVDAAPRRQAAGNSRKDS